MPPPDQDQRDPAAPASRAPPSHFPWPPVLFLITVLGGWGLQRLWPLAWPGLNDRPAKVIGWVFVVGGFGLAGWALVTMLRGNAEFRPHAEATVLITHGPFRRLRNPMYLGYALILLGLADSAQNIWIAILTPAFALAVTWLAILPEEHHLAEKFGDAYFDYKSRTRRWI